MRLVFLGSGEFGVPTLARLLEEHEVLAAVTQPDRPAGRDRAPTPTPIASFLQERAPRVEVIKAERVNELSVVERVRGSGPDALVVIAFGQKLGSALLEHRFAINLHASLLPRWRGAAPINHAILAGDEETGNSVITLAATMDAGRVLAQSRRGIGRGDTAGELHDALSLDGPALVLGVLKDFAEGKVAGREQDPALVTPAPKLHKRDAWIDFGEGATDCRRRVHGLTPWPGVSVGLGGAELKLLRVEETAGRAGSEPGELLSVEEGVVACADGTGLRLVSVQPAGRRAMSWAEFARGRRVEAGARLIGGRAC